ncbi:hypothetical protein O3G_MSEX009423 [Manduca sexta]|uniref:Conserved oligomeric Golgi complex subunit 7 n=1 Tax=Manduca sexta TaxID=7130 RepID=A0A922CRV0_MANSE|nr:hypothetical protein O3G_MSEX009423 [Manduca sexta]
MELKTFAEDDFDPKKWINNAWSSSGNQEKEVFVANTVSRLQLYMKQLTNSLDETTTQIATSLPRIVQDVSALQLEGELLQQKMLSLEQKFQSVEEQTGHSIESLQKIDQLKSRLENAASALREADKWAALATSLEDILETGVPTESDKLAELAKQVTAMTASLEVLSDAPDYESKRLQLETLYNRLEALISPPLIDALTQMDAAKHKKDLAHEQLKAINVEWLVVLKSETPLAELVRLYTDLLLSLDPAPTKVVSASLKLCSSAEEGVVMLIDLKRDIEEFVVSIKRVLDAPRQNKEVVPPATVRELGRAAYAPLRELLSKYTEMQTQLLLNNLKDPQLDQEDLLERSRALLSVAERCEGWLTTAYNGAKKIAGNAVYPYYIPAVEVFITALSSHISSHSRRIETVFLSSVTAGQITGVLSTTFPASLVLETATAVLLDALAQRQKAEREEEEVKDPSPLFDLPTLLLDSEGRQQLLNLRSEALPSVAGLRRVKEQLKTLARAILRNPVDVQLDKIPQLSVWCNNDALSTDLPDFALSPQEYITEIGQYLMTLPQHLEMHLSEKQAPWQFLSDVCTHTCEIYAEKILNIRNMDALGTKRCLTDIAYLSSVVEDLGTSVTPALKSLEKSLRAATPSQTTE